MITLVVFLSVIIYLIVYCTRNSLTVLHDFFCQFGKSKIFVQKKPEGHGLVCHRVIREVCKAVGIKDIYAKVEGSTKNVQHVAKAFMMGLLQQVYCRFYA